jgi:hypothetical protein
MPAFVEIPLMSLSAICSPLMAVENAFFNRSWSSLRRFWANVNCSMVSGQRVWNDIDHDGLGRTPQIMEIQATRT